MSKFNKPSLGTKTTNLAGGKSYSISAELEIATIMLTSFADDKFYRSNMSTANRLQELIPRCSPKYLAQLAVYTRTHFGMRSISHILASLIAPVLSGKTYATSFYDRIIYRPDDITEIIAYHKGTGHKLSSAMKKGFALSLERFNDYTLAKYKGKNKDWSLVDVFNILHPKPANDKRADLYRKIMTNSLPSFDTWESELSAIGQLKVTDAQKAKLKAKAWGNLIDTNKLGYFALLRNLRNIVEQAPKHLDKALEQLQNEDAIRHSLVLPFRYSTAYEQFKSGNSDSRKILMAIDNAVDISTRNVPKFKGDTVVILDVSGSMSGKPAEIGALFTAVLAKSNNADIVTFSDNAKYMSYNPKSPTLELAKTFRFSMGGTNFQAALETLNKKYDRIILLSDMQSWLHDRQMPSHLSKYRNKYNARPMFYSFDLAGYGTTLLPENNIFCLAGFSEKVFELMAVMEEGNSLRDEIKKVDL